MDFLDRAVNEAGRSLDRLAENLGRQLETLERDSTAGAGDPTLDQVNDPVELRKRIVSARELFQRAQTLIQRVTAPPYFEAHVLEVGDLPRNGKDGEENLPSVPPAAVILYKGERVHVGAPQDKNIRPGDRVKISASTMQIVDIAPSGVGLGEVTVVQRVVDGDRSEVNSGNGTRIVWNAANSGKTTVGDRLVLDASLTIALANLGKAEGQFQFIGATGVSWSDIKGLEEAKAQLIDIVETPYTHAELFQRYGGKLPKGAVIYGPPRCGKSMLMKAVYTAMERVHGKEKAQSGYRYLSGAEILQPLVGVGERMLKDEFAACRAHKEKYGFPATLVIDEADAILRKRGKGISSDATDSIVTAYLAETDGVRECGAVVFILTNRQDILDPAVTGDGRADIKIKVGRPARESAEEILLAGFKKVPLQGFSAEELTALALDQFYSPERAYYEITRRIAAGQETIKFTLADVVNCAMLAGVPIKAAAKAQRRDRKNAVVDGGVGADDVRQAIDQIFRENKDLDHKDALEEFCADFRERLMGINPIRQNR